MKKSFLFALAIACVLVVSMSGCRRGKASCAAYDQVPTEKTN